LPGVAPSKTPFLIALGAVLRERRRELGLSQQQLATIASISQRRVWEWEQGRRNAGIETLRKYVEHMDLPLIAAIARADVLLADEARQIGAKGVNGHHY
jgi:transcriptional regulator with XRE-family HTH domain